MDLFGPSFRDHFSAAFQKYEDHLCKLYATYTLESVRDFHLNFHQMAINDGVDATDSWSRIDTFLENTTLIKRDRPLIVPPTLTLFLHSKRMAITRNSSVARVQQQDADLAKYEKQKKAFGDIITFIQDTIAAHNVTFIQKDEAHPRNLVRALKQRLAPSDEARSTLLQIERSITNCTNGKEHGIAETTGTRPIRDFLMAVRTKEQTFSDAHLVMIRRKDSTYDFYSLIEDLRQHIRLLQLQRLSNSSTHSAVATVGAWKPMSSLGQDSGTVSQVDVQELVSENTKPPS
ncbi:hypothetical protein MMC07_004835 [Pseudocyphellaria aurata]|nr:hypothetical protein [Pseudocyphellaria aurata]